MPAIPKRITAIIFMTAVILSSMSPVSAAAAETRTSFDAAAVSEKAPANFRFVRWNNTRFTSCLFAWDTAYDSAGKSATDYEIKETWTDGSHFWHGITAKKAVNINNHEYNHITIAHVRARWKKHNSNTHSSYYVYSAWSPGITVCPMPLGVSASVPDKSKPYVRVTWNPVYGCSGYNVFLTKNPAGRWTWNQSTAESAKAVTASVRAYQRASLQPYTNYYLRVVTRRKYKGIFRSVPVPGAAYYALRFQLTRTGKK